jgi:hypothetical protein
MTCSYRIIVCFDGGPRSLEVPVVSLNYIRNKFNASSGNRFTFEWVDVIVSYGESNVLSLLLAKSPTRFQSDLNQLLDAFQANRSLVQSRYNDYFADSTLRDLERHVLLNYHDGKRGLLHSISTLSPYQEGKRLSELVSCFIRSEEVHDIDIAMPNENTYFVNPIQQAVNLANCLYPDDSLVILSIGSQMRNLSSNVTTELAHIQMREQLRRERRVHYFRLSLPFEPNVSFEDNKRNMESFLDKEWHLVDRLFRLMELKAGRLL